MNMHMKSFAIALALSTALSSAALAATKVGVVGALNPSATATDADGATRALKVGDAVFLNDRISTTDKGSAQLMFLDKSALTISPASVIKIDEFVYNPATGDGTMSMESAKGAFRFIGGALTKKKPVKIKTPVSTIGIRGGIVDGHVGANGATDAVFIFGDEMSMTNENGQTTSTTNFGTGLGMNTPTDQPTQLPPGAVQQLITNSPVEDAVNNSPATGDAGLDNKVNINTGGNGASGGGDGGAGGGNAPAGGGSSGGGSSSNEGGTSDGGGDSLANAPALDSSGNASDGTANGNGGDGLLAGAPTGGTQGDSGQQAIRSNVQDFVESGGDADNDGQLDFNIAGTDLADPTNPNQPTFINPNAGNPPPPTGGNTPPTNGGTTPPPTGGTTTPPPVVNTPTTPPSTISGGGGGGGGGGGFTNTAPTALNDTMPGSFYDKVAPTDTNPQTSAINLLSNDTDVDPGQTLGITAGSYNGTHGTLTIDATGNATYTYTGAGIAAGSSVTDSITYTMNDGAGGTATATVYIPITGKDYFGGTTAWSTTAPTITAPTDSGSYVFHDSSAGTTREKGGLQGRQMTNYFDIMMKRDDGALDSADYTIGRAGLNAGWTAGSMYTFAASDFFFEEATGPNSIATGFTGLGYRTGSGATSAMHYYQMGWTEGANTMRLRAVLGDQPINTSFASATAAHTAVDTMRTNAQIWANANNLGSDGLAATAGDNSNIIAYNFLPEMYMDNAYGYLNYNFVQGFQDGNTPISGGAPLSNTGLMVDWGAKRYMGGYLDFLGTKFGTSSDPNPRLIATVGKVNVGTDIGGTASASPLANGTLLLGKLFDVTAKDADATSSISLSEMKGYTGNTNVNPINSFANSAAGSAIEGMLLGGLVLDRDGVGVNREILQPLVQTTGAQNLSNLQANILLDTPGETIQHQGYSAGLMYNNAGAVTRIKSTSSTSVGITLQQNGSTAANSQVFVQGTSGASKVDYTKIDGNLGAATGAGSARFGETASPTSHSAVMDTNRYMATTNADAETGYVTDGLIASSKAVGAEGLVCSTCTFAHWGVWSATLDHTGNPDQHTMLVPYVAGQVTSNPAGLSGLGVQNYSGQAVGNFAFNPVGTPSAVTTVNAVGTMNAAIDFSTRAIAANGLTLNFSGVGHPTRAISITNAAALTNTALIGGGSGTGPAHFTTSGGDGGGVNISFTDNTGTTNAAITDGNMNGALFGTNAEEIGGNFYAAGSATNEEFKAGGIFLGKRP